MAGRGKGNRYFSMLRVVLVAVGLCIIIALWILFTGPHVVMDKEKLLMALMFKGHRENLGSGGKCLHQNGYQWVVDDKGRTCKQIADVHVMPVIQKPAEASCAAVKDAKKFDCYPENSRTKARCEARGCCWKPKYTDRNFEPSGAFRGVPSCFYPLNYPGYKIISQKTTQEGITAMLNRSTKSYYPRDVMLLKMDVTFETDHRLHIKITDAEKKRYEVPVSKPNTRQKAGSPQYEITMAKEPFSFKVTRKSDKATLLDTSVGAFLYADQFLQLSSLLPSRYVYGLGEHRSPLRHSLNWTSFTLWNSDHAPIGEDKNLYGSHPFYLVMEDSGLSHGVFLLNSNAMDVTLQPAPALTWRTVGGILDFYVFLGPTPADVVSQYTEVIGRPFMPPYWSLGYHQCRWGYKTAAETLAVVDRLKKYGIPQDVQWNDNDYSHNYQIFTTDRQKFGDQSQLVETLHNRGLHYIIIVDPCVSTNQTQGTYPPYDLGLKGDLFIKNITGQPLVGKVWPETCVWPDFTNVKTESYWQQISSAFHKKVPIDGMWIDMNEPSNFINGSYSGCPRNSRYESPPYVPVVHWKTLWGRTLCSTARQSLSIHYDVHNLYGYTMSRASYNALAMMRMKRPFVISRSTFPGQSQYGGHWTGDNLATYHDMKMSIPAVLTMNLLATPMVGSDICGFMKNATEQMCQRWMQLGAFYPFSRNHNDRGHRDQDPASFGPAMAASSRKALLTRYSLLPYLYTLFHHSHRQGHTVARPLFFEFMEDKETWSIDTQFLWGAALLVSPVLTQDTTVVKAYFAKGVWYDFYNGSLVKGSQWVKLDAPLDRINLHVRGGYILPMQEPALTTTASRNKPFQLLVALDRQGKAEGELFWDDGDTIDTYGLRQYALIQFIAAANTIKSTVVHQGLTSKMVLGEVQVYGVRAKPGKVLVNGQQQQFVYKGMTGALYIQNMSINLMKDFTIKWNQQQ